jgi:hypothetical protein
MTSSAALVDDDVRAWTPSPSACESQGSSPPAEAAVMCPEEQRVVSATPTGHVVNLATCVVVRVDDAGLITSVDEYVDTSTFSAPG